MLFEYGEGLTLHSRAMSDQHFLLIALSFVYEAEQLTLMVFLCKITILLFTSKFGIKLILAWRYEKFDAVTNQLFWGLLSYHGF